MLFFLLHCDQCGREKNVGTDKIIATNLSWNDNEGINKSKARCPRCRSDNYVMAPNGQRIMYD